MLKNIIYKCCIIIDPRLCGSYNSKFLHPTVQYKSPKFNKKKTIIDITKSAFSYKNNSRLCLKYTIIIITNAALLIQDFSDHIIQNSSISVVGQFKFGVKTTDNFKCAARIFISHVDPLTQFQIKSILKKKIKTKLFFIWFKNY